MTKGDILDSLDNLNCWMSTKEIAAKLSFMCNEKNMGRHLKRLADDGEILRKYKKRAWGPAEVFYKSRKQNNG